MNSPVIVVIHFEMPLQELFHNMIATDVTLDKVLFVELHRNFVIQVLVLLNLFTIVVHLMTKIFDRVLICFRFQSVMVFMVNGRMCVFQMSLVVAIRHHVATDSTFAPGMFEFFAWNIQIYFSNKLSITILEL